MPRLPDGVRIYAIGDIHGRADLLDRLLAMICSDAALRPDIENRLVFLGDYIDRGPDSHGVVDRLLNALPAGMPADFLMGNHERMMLDAWANPGEHPMWWANGGHATEKSYRAAETHGDSGHRHQAFFETLQLSASHGDYLFVHAGVRPGVPLSEQDPQDLLWIREPFLSDDSDHGKIVVHGHTPTDAPEVRPNRIGVDTGAVFTGRLTALVLEGDGHRFLST